MPVIEGIEGGSDQKSCQLCQQFNPNAGCALTRTRAAWANGMIQGSCIRSTPRIGWWSLAPNTRVLAYECCVFLHTAPAAEWEGFSQREQIGLISHQHLSVREGTTLAAAVPDVARVKHHCECVGLEERDCMWHE